MNTIIKAVLTAACVVAIAVPLVSWAKDTSKNRDHYHSTVVRQAPFALTPQTEFVW